MPNYTTFINNYLIINIDGEIALYRYLKETKKYIHTEKHFIKTINSLYVHSLDQPIKIYSFNETPAFTKVNKDIMKNRLFNSLWNDTTDFNKIRFVEGHKFGSSLFFDKSFTNNRNVDSLNESLIPKISKLFRLYQFYKEDNFNEYINDIKEHINQYYTIHQKIQYNEIINDITFIFYKLKIVNKPTYARIDETIDELIGFIENIFGLDIIKKCPLCRCDNKIILDNTKTYKKLFVKSDEDCCICMDNKSCVKLPICNHIILCNGCFTKL